MEKLSSVSNHNDKALGQLIREARERSQLTVDDVARKLLLGRSIIAAMEQDDYAVIPAMVYAEGYLRSYANLLNLPVNSIIEKFRKSEFYGGVSELCETSCITMREKQNVLQWLRLKPGLLKDNKVWFVVSGLVMILLIALAVSSFDRDGHTLDNVKPAEMSIGNDGKLSGLDGIGERVQPEFNKSVN